MTYKDLLRDLRAAGKYTDELEAHVAAVSAKRLGVLCDHALDDEEKLFYAAEYIHSHNMTTEEDIT